MRKGRLQDDESICESSYYVLLVTVHRRCAVISLCVGVWERMCHGCAFVLSLPDFVCLSVCNASFSQISQRDLCRSLLARLTSATKFVYFKNGYYESSSRGAPVRTVL